MNMVRRFVGARVLSAVAAIALAASGMVLGSATAQVVAPVDCPRAIPTSEVSKGMTGTGFTVSEGTEPEPFDVEILGVLQDGVAPGRDMIIVDTSSPAIEEAGGIWFGMSGSPVYASDGRLIGAVAFGLSFGPSTVGGLTPAQDMMELLDYPSAVETTAARKVTVSGGLAHRVNQRSSSRGDSATFTRLRAPLSVSGLGARGFDVLAEAIHKEGDKYLPTTGPSSYAAGPQVELGSIGAGDNFAAALSYGDVTMAGIGTTTLVCGDKLVAFGHPFGWAGKTRLGANEASAHTIVKDFFGPYKLADITDPVGIVDQDRLAGIRGLLGEAPILRPVTSSVTATDLNRTRVGSSQGATDDIVPTLGFYHLFTNIDSTFDEIGEGSSEVSWTITGSTEDGEPWALTRSNLYSSQFDISFASSSELFGQLITLLENRFTEIDFGSVDVEATVADEPSGYRISKVLHSTNNRDFTGGRRVKVRPGGKLFLKVRLASVTQGENKTVLLSFQLPRRFRGGFIELGGGGGSESDFFCFEEFGSCSSPTGGKIENFDDLVDSLEDAPKGNELTASLMSRRGRLQQQKSVELDGVVDGSRFLVLQVNKGQAGSGSAGK